MPQSPPRKRFQVHLSTAIVLMFVAGALIWANVTPTIFTKEFTLKDTGTNIAFTKVTYGWPSTVFGHAQIGNGVIPEMTQNDINMLNVSYEPKLTLEFLNPYSSYSHAALNLLIALLLLLATWYLCEKWISYRAARKGP